ncbi:AYR1 NADPH-dependent 1-acyldihydroxyacetone phosphate reductase [Candida maltosa Xu316]|uniref:Likely dihydroxyacetone phosphate reductase n=1 Tax=Candida maltosa (strain Xu316) TaxID=1245528 RepID=M3K5F3_CANMX|nr:Likely dihydroxyacetone phosphate reductase [Candida maltosa Xu316]
MPDKKYALISGASSGIGYAVAKELSKRGYTVFGCSPAYVLHLQKPLEEEYGLISIACDITKLDDIKHAKEVVESHTNGNLDLLFNNAGIAIGGPAIEIPEDDLNLIFQVNVIGHINMTKHFAPFVIKRKGSIVYTSSVAARVPLSWISAYSATKAAIDAYAKTLHGEMEPFGVSVHSIITGGVKTGIGSQNKVEEIQKDMKDSLYNVDGVVESVIETSNMSKDKGIPADKYAKNVVGKITRRNKKFNLYAGASAGLLHYLGLYYPLWLVEYFMQKVFKQLLVFKNIRKKYRK